jgi:hypothetical protein
MTAALILLAAALTGNYDCAIEHQIVLTENGFDTARQTVMFPESEQDAWRFGVRVPRGDAPRIVVDWPANPIQIAGTHQTLPLAPGQVAFVALSGGPCMFTEQNCATMVEFSAREDGGMAFSILPAGSTRAESGVRSLFHVVFIGTCRRRSEG